MFMPMGHGKTRIVLTAIKQLLNEGDIRKVLVVAPKAVAISTWPGEIDIVGELDYTLIDGGHERRYRAAEHSAAPIHLLGVDNLVWLIDNSKFDYDMIIVDESTKFKSVNAIKYIELDKVVNNPFSLITRVVIMSGTPIGNTYLNLWSQMNLIDGGRRLGKHHKYQDIFFESSGPYKKDLREGAADLINSMVEDICYNEPDDDIVKPDERHHKTYVPLDSDTRDIYNTVRDTLQHDFGDAYGINAVNAAVAMNKLLQVCSGHVYPSRMHPPIGDIDDPDNPFWPPPKPRARPVHTNKMARLKELRTLIPEPVIIAINYKFERDAILHEFPDARVLSPANVIKWNKGEISELVLHPKSAGHGLNLQFGGRTIIWYTLTWSVEDYMQMNARISRRGQKDTETHIHHIIAETTIESQMIRVLENRRIVQDGFMTSIVREELFG